jgi:hypothetical protein
MMTDDLSFAPLKDLRKDLQKISHQLVAKISQSPNHLAV